MHVAAAEYGEAEEMLARVLDDNPDHAQAADIFAKLKERRAAEANKLEIPAEEAQRELGLDRS